MRRFLMLILVFAAAFLSCKRQEQEAVLHGGFPEGEKVTIHFSLPGFQPGTKALDEGGDLNSLHVAVFGGSGYLKEYVKATIMETGTHVYEDYDKDSTLVSHTVPKYGFSVTLTLSESPRTVHIIGNGPDVLPFGYDTAVLPTLLSEEGEKAYWQMISLPEGIRAKQINGKYVDIDDNEIPEGGSGYVPDQTTAQAFENIALIRNWSKIVLTAASDSNFEPISLAVVNVPSRGSIVPYSSQTGGFISGYQHFGFKEIEESGYPASLPAGATFDNTIPEPSDFTPASQAVYLYERPIPTTSLQPSYVLIYGHFTDPEPEVDGDSSGDYYYKVDLMETKKVGDSWESSYYPIYRNFKYQVVVKAILSAGYATPPAAAASAGSADVSSDVTTAHLSDISDGIGRLHLSPWTSKTFTREYPVDHPLTELSVYFSQSPDGEPDMEEHSVTLELLDPEDGGEDLIYNVQMSAPSQESGSRGWRNISLCLNAPDQYLSRTQVLRITGIHEYGRLYRDVEITMQPIQPILVMCEDAFLPKTKGAPQDVMLMVPDGLTQSMFPLDFIIEPEACTLTPDNSKPNNNLPVVSGESISEHGAYSGKTTFQFIRTLTWEEYRSLPIYLDDSNNIWRTIHCYFKTNRAISATTVWVYNEFFRKGSDTFDNYNYKTFGNLTFNSPIPLSSDTEIQLSFEMEEESGRVYPDSYPEVTVKAIGLYTDDPNLSPGNEEGSYVFKPTGHNVSLTFITTTSDGDISIGLSALEYEDATLVPWRFRNAGFVNGQRLKNISNVKWSNVAFDHVNAQNGGKTVMFAYSDDPLHPNTTVTLHVDGLLSNGTTSGFVMDKPYTPTPYTEVSDPLYHEIDFKTGSVWNYSDVVYVLSADGYVTERGTIGRFEGNIRTMNANNNTMKSFVVGVENATKTLTEDDGQCEVSFSLVSGNSSGAHLEAGTIQTFTVTNKKAGNELMFVRFKFLKEKNGTVNAPSLLTPSVGTIEKYPGAVDQYIWLLPRGLQTATISLTAPDERNIIVQELVVKTVYNCKLYTHGRQEQ